MGKDLKKDIARLKKEYIDLEGAFQDERECLSRVINALCILAARDEDLREEIRIIKAMSNSSERLPIEKMDGVTSRLKDQIIAKETESASEGGEQREPADAEKDLIEACMAMKRVMVVLLEGFYPLTRRLETRASTIHLDCKAFEIDRFKQEAEGLLDFLDGLKEKISMDFRYIDSAFLTLLEKVKDLEKTLAGQFGGEEPIRKIEYYDMKINGEMSAIVTSFDLHASIDEIKNTVIRKIQNIKQVVAHKKRDDLKKAQLARENMKLLKERIAEADQHAREMSKRAEELKMVAMKDGLTGLYNRTAFDLKIEGALRTIKDTGEPFSLMLLDVDKFKEINDTFGHVAGDKVLEKVAQSLKETFRETDFIARYGGDEFVVLIEHLSEAMAMERLSNFRRNLAKRRFVSYKKGPVDITVSAGISLAESEDSLESVLDRADRAMYAEKKNQEKRE
ncbi:MAG: GGDEF domain-containing protein [Desulfatiglandaceae bacterium]